VTDVAKRYRAVTERSGRHHERARRVIPAGATRSLNDWPPNPIYVTHGSGSAIWDLDGREYVDFLNNYTAVVLGHAHPAVVEAVRERLEKGTSFSFSTELEAELAELLVERIPSVERVRFMGSGTEAAMFALRLARSFTNRPAIAKVEGGFHGTYDDVQVSVRPAMDRAGPIATPASLPETGGLRARLAEDVLVLPFNHIAETEALIEAHRDRLAAVLVEPILGVGGMITPADGYLARLRELCTRHGILLVFDEVITLRLAPGGAQELFGVMPDLTVMGKIIGGGMPIGALGGTSAVMAHLEPSGGYDVYDPRSGGARVYQGGTFTGNPLSLAAGLATLRIMDRAAYERLNGLGDALRARVDRLLRELEVPMSVTGLGSLFNLHATPGPVHTFRDARTADAERQQAVFLGLLNEGVMIAPRGMGCLSVPMTDVELNRFEMALAAVIRDVFTGGC
jgi:glutamate-1-semialdehyde 2,1-aminomutase